MANRYGTARVLEPKFVIPTSAWRLDNSRNIRADEMRISVELIHLEGTSFKQICTEANNNPDEIKRAIIDTVIRRGKLHNPVTDTGGVLCGRIEAIGDDYTNDRGLAIGDRVIVNASLTSFPMSLESITDIDRVFNQISARGFAILHGEGNGNPLQCSCLENPMDRGGWWAAVCGVTQSQTRLK